MPEVSDFSIKREHLEICTILAKSDKKRGSLGALNWNRFCPSGRRADLVPGEVERPQRGVGLERPSEVCGAVWPGRTGLEIKSPVEVKTKDNCKIN